MFTGGEIAEVVKNYLSDKLVGTESNGEKIAEVNVELFYHSGDDTNEVPLVEMRLSGRLEGSSEWLMFELTK